MSKIKTQIKIGKHLIDVTNPDKLIFPKDKITKADVVDYYQRIAKVMLPHMQDRLVSMQRFPDGIEGEAFFQKQVGEYFPSWIKTKAIKKKEGGSTDMVICNDAATLVYLATQLVLTPHIWLSRTDKLHYPDHMIFDLDPSKGAGFSAVMLGAKRLKKVLQKHKLVPFVMTTGSRGLHVVVPLKRTEKFDKVRAFARHIAQEMAVQDPKHFTIEMSLAKRGKRVFIDYLRNGFGATGVAPYAIRPHPKAPVATPLTWTELTKSLTSQKYNIGNVFARLSKKGDPWKKIDKYARTLPAIESLTD